MKAGMSLVRGKPNVLFLRFTLFGGVLKSFNLVWVSLRRTTYDTTFASRKKKRASQLGDFVRSDCIYEGI